MLTQMVLSKKEIVKTHHGVHIRHMQWSQYTQVGPIMTGIPRKMAGFVNILEFENYLSYSSL